MAVSGNSSDLLISRIGQLSRLSGQLIEQELATIGITFQEMRIAGLLMGEAGITQKELAAKLSVKPATLSVAITQLEKQGLIHRQTNPDDKRVQFLTLKPSKKIDAVDRLLQKLDKHMCRGLNKQALATTHSVITGLINNLILDQNETLRSTK